MNLDFLGFLSLVKLVGFLGDGWSFWLQSLHSWSLQYHPLRPGTLYLASLVNPGEHFLVVVGEFGVHYLRGWTPESTRWIKGESIEKTQYHHSPVVPRPSTALLGWSIGKRWMKARGLKHREVPVDSPFSALENEEWNFWSLLQRGSQGSINCMHSFTMCFDSISHIGASLAPGIY